MAVRERLSLRNLYLYLVCLITLLITIFAVVGLVRATVELVYPDPGYYFEYAPEQQLTEDERERQEQRAAESQRRQAVINLVGSGTTLLIAAPLYVYHWRRVQKELPGQPADPEPAGP